MPVLVSCHCGKQLRVPDEYVGKRVKCTACGEVQTVKAAENGNNSRVPKQPLPKTTAYSPPPPSKPGVLRFECSECGKQMQARAEHAGRTAKCPACGVAVAIPEPEAEEIEEAEEVQEEDRRARFSASKAAPRKKIVLDEEAEEAEEAEEVDEEEDDRPRKKGKKAARGKKKGRNLGLLIGVGVGVLLLLVGGGVLLWYMLGSSGSSGSGSDLAFVLPEAQMVVAVQVAALWNTPVTQELLRNLPGDAKNNLDEMEKKTGLKPADIDRVLAVFPDLDSKQPLVVITTNKPVDRKKILEGLEADPAERKHQNRAYHVSKKGMNDPGIHFVSDKLFVLGGEVGLKLALDHVAGATKKAPGKLANSLKLVDGRNQLVVAMVPPGAQVQQIKQMAQANPLAGQYVSLLELQSGALTASLVANTLQIEITGTFPGEPAAKAAKSTLDTLKTQANGFILFIQDPQQKADAQKALTNLSIDQKGADVLVRTSAEINVNDLMKMAGGPLGGPFGGPVGGAAGNLASQNNLKQMGLAFHNYASVYNGKMPSAVIYNGNQKLYSWRVEILPYVEQDNLYKILRGKPWDDPLTRGIATNQMPKLFQIPNRPAPPGMTYYKLFTGPKALFDDKREVKLPASFPKGTSNMILAVEARQAVFWTQPDDIPFNPNGNPINDLHWDASGSCNVLLADGSVRKIRRTVNPQSLKNAIMPLEGGQPGPDF